MTKREMRNEKSPFELMDFSGALIDSLSEAAKTIAKDQGKDLALGLVSDLVKDMTSEAAGAFVGAFAKAAFKLLLRQQDKIAELSTKLDALVRSPLTVGVRAATAALAVEALTADQVAFREKRLLFAVEQLDVALAHLPVARSMASPTFCAHVLQGICYRELRGGIPFMRVAFSHAARVVQMELESEKKLAVAEELLAEQCRSAENSEGNLASSSLEHNYMAFTGIAGVCSAEDMLSVSQQYKDNANERAYEASAHEGRAAEAQRRADSLQLLHQVLVNA